MTKEEKKGEELKQEEKSNTDIQGQLNYAQKIINVLQAKVNELNGKMVQLEAQLMMANEDRENMLQQLEPMGIGEVQQ